MSRSTTIDLSAKKQETPRKFSKVDEGLRYFRKGKHFMHSVALYRIERPSRKPTKGFEKRYSPELNEERKDEFRDEIWDWSEQQVKTAMGFINAVTFSIAEKIEAIYIRQDGKRGIIAKRIQRLCKYGCRQLHTTVKGIAQYISEWWDEVIAESDRRAVRKVRDALAAMRLLKFEKLDPHKRSWQTFFDIDFGGLLMLYEVLEEALLGDHYCDFNDDLPEHKGALVRAFYNTCEDMLGIFRRSGSSTEDDDEEEAAKPKPIVPFVCKYTIDGEEFDANLFNRRGVSFRDVVFAEKARLEKLRRENPQFAKKQWFDSANYYPRYDLPY